MPLAIDGRVLSSIKGSIAAADRILVITHINPDGDALGSLAAMGLALDQIGKERALVCDDGILERFRYLPLAGEIQKESGSREWGVANRKNSPTPHPSLPTPFDLIISLDCGDMSRMGRAYDELPEPKPPVINIDHHITNTRFGTINLIDTKATSTTEILYALFSEFGLELTSGLATCLLTGLVTDTLCFRTAGVTPDTLEAASRLMQAGANLAEITRESLLLKPLHSLLLWRSGLNHLRLEGGLLWTTVSKAERLEMGYEGSGTAGLVNALGDVYQANVGAVLMELDDGRVNVSFRCRPPFSVAELAVNLGGGGHDLAAGCTLDGPLDRAEALVVGLTKDVIRRQKSEFTLQTIH